MKKNIIITLLLLGVLLPVFNACQEDPLDPNSVIVDRVVDQNKFDKWLYDNHTIPYNIDVNYRFLDRESDLSYNVIPATMDASIKLAILVKHLCIETYDEVTGSKDFIRSYCPKLLFFIGSPEYKNNGVIVLGTAEGGKTINLFNVNALKADDIASLNSSYFKTIHHEFGHILNHTKPFSTDFLAISSSMYVGDDCFDTYSSVTNSIKDGFISPYASSQDTEDFVEMLSIFLVSDNSVWDGYMEMAKNSTLEDGRNAYDILSQKFEIVYNYMKDSWGIDIYDMRTILHRRQTEISSLDFNID